MYFYHSDEIWSRFPALSALVLTLNDVRTANSSVVAIDQTLKNVAARLKNTAEGDMPSIAAWRQAYSAIGLKPTQYRCAAEALLRRFRKDNDLPRFHPLIDVLNAESMNAAIPIAAFDCSKITSGICVRSAIGTEVHRTFQGEIEYPAVGEVIFADATDQAHSRRWVFRQGATSVVSRDSDTVLVVAEALHDAASNDLELLRKRIERRAVELGISIARQDLLTASNRRFYFAL